jgi:hypothetical protein
MRRQRNATDQIEDRGAGLRAAGNAMVHRDFEHVKARKIPAGPVIYDPTVSDADSRVWRARHLRLFFIYRGPTLAVRGDSMHVAFLSV